ncbi:MAG: serine hydrolase domain-containing protein [Promethearchaeota archaeon]|jgi:CubicO group peptidase (beta-lactamase class C family)
MVEIQGFCDKRFESVKKAFEKNFKEGLEVGASFAATINGKFVIDIWAGHADAAQSLPWEENTIVNVYSTTKVMTAICTLMLIDRGLLDLDAPVARYWPEFAQNGKEEIPVRFLLSHTSGLSGWEKKITVEDLYDWDKVTNLLAAQKPWWEPGTKSGYHSSTFGNLLGELVRRITGKTIGTFFKEEVAEPLNGDFHIGLPEKYDYRVGELIPPPSMNINQNSEIDPNSIAFKTGMNPLMNPEETKTRAWRAAELPADNGHCNARAVARITSAIACGGEVDGVRLMSIDTIEKALEEQSYGTDLVLMAPIRFGLGFGLQEKESPIGPNQRILYWGGWGGSVSIMDLDAKLSIAYVMNKMQSITTGDPRSDRLIGALYGSI